MTDPNPTDSGIITVGEERWIPGSRRADGSYRPARKVRAGFTPLEDVQRYASPQARQQAEQEQQRQLQRRREQEQKQKSVTETKPHTQPTATNDSSAEERKIRNLQKKIRQVEELEQKLIKGEKLNDDQREKVKKGKALRDELAKLTASTTS